MSNATRDHCPYCNCNFEILKVKFGFGGPAMVWTCPNCSLMQTEPSRTVWLLDAISNIGPAIETALVGSSRG